VSKSILLKIARDSIEEVILAKNSIDRVTLLENYPVLNEKVATFITINLNGKLRGCIGSLVAQKSLLEDIIYNAKAAAFHDPRFLPITTSDYIHSSIEVSILTEPKEVKYNSIDELKSIVNVGEDGVILLHEDKQATFLPQVWDELTTFEDFFSHLLQKANLTQDTLNLNPLIYTYQVAKESDDPIVKEE
jgi:AmmeMemoRadiSam system protein A